MPLEDLVGNKFISDLNENWPAGTDLPDAGDDHLRGIKNVLKRTFPNVNGPITRSDEEINLGSIPKDAVLAFYMAASPQGWSRVTVGNTFGLRIVPDASVGGASGGSDDPVLNDKVPSHTHGFSGTSAVNSNDHTHAISLWTGSENAAHTHGVSDPGHSHVETIGGAALGAQYYAGSGWVNSQQNTGASVTGISLGTQSVNHQHAVNGNTGGISANHSHAYSGTTVANPSPANWTPRYMDFILCRKD